jgi:hypothetical protein
VTTIDIVLGFSDFGDWLLALEERATAWSKRTALAAADWIYDRVRWLRREISRRKGYPTGARRAGAHQRGFTVWDYLHALPIEELRYQWRPRGQHRERRGWRYPSALPALIERLREYRAWEVYWATEVERLMDDIHYMLDHPPAVASVTVHGCQDCLCGQIAQIRAEALA